MLHSVDKRDVPVNRRQVFTMVATGSLSALAGCGSITGQSTETETEIDFPTSVRKKWAVETGGSVRSSPTVTDGTVYIGSYDANVYALSAETGAERWSFQTSGKIESSPTVVNGTVYIGNNDGILYAVSAEDGTEKWSFETGTDNEICTTPAVFGGTVYVASNDNSIGSSSQGRLYAVSAADGTQQWAFSERSVLTSPVVTHETGSDGTVYFGSEAGSVYALSAADGSKKWEFEFDVGHIEAPTVVGDTLYIGSATDLYALSVDDGTTQWGRRDADDHSTIMTQPTVVDDDIYIGRSNNGRDSSGLDVVSSRVGKRKWNFGTLTVVQTKPAVHNGVVHFASDAGKVYAVSVRDGTELWTFDATGTEPSSVSVMNSSPTVVADTVYIGSDSGTVYALVSEYAESGE